MSVSRTLRRSIERVHPRDHPRRGRRMSHEVARNHCCRLPRRADTHGESPSRDRRRRAPRGRGIDGAAARGRGTRRGSGRACRRRARSSLRRLLLAELAPIAAG